jgi:hypothetical protein
MLHKLCLLRSANNGNNAPAVMMARGDFEIFLWLGKSSIQADDGQA